MKLLRRQGLENQIVEMGVLLQPAPDQAEIRGRKLPLDLACLCAGSGGGRGGSRGWGKGRRAGVGSGAGAGGIAVVATSTTTGRSATSSRRAGGMAASSRHGMPKHKPKLTLPRPVRMIRAPMWRVRQAASSTGTRGKRPSGRA